MSPLRQRMIDDMTMRRLKPTTQSAYVRHVIKFAEHLERSPATAEELRAYQLHLANGGMAPSNLNATLTALRFLFQVTLEHGNVLAKLCHVREPRKLPEIFSRAEVTRLIRSAGNL